jgi:hypothetical protein
MQQFENLKLESQNIDLTSTNDIPAKHEQKILEHWLWSARNLEVEITPFRILIRNIRNFAVSAGMQSVKHNPALIY